MSALQLHYVFKNLGLLPPGIQKQVKDDVMQKKLDLRKYTVTKNTSSPEKWKVYDIGFFTEYSDYGELKDGKIAYGDGELEIYMSLWGNNMADGFITDATEEDIMGVFIYEHKYERMFKYEIKDQGVNGLLFDLGKNNYLFVSDGPVYTFKTNEKITSIASYDGESFYAFTKTEVYYLYGRISEYSQLDFVMNEEAYFPKYALKIDVENDKYGLLESDSWKSIVRKDIAVDSIARWGRHSRSEFNEKIMKKLIKQGYIIGVLGVEPPMNRIEPFQR